ncbi:unnamed protein product [Meganyctiphanes norvegica]|uniref:E3 ubiquitin-protein ligase E3D n=1 Tax=Meganyctiphanes norvegica TaxID=48144 RepID=A0AAV2SV74_MEGNR
MAAVLVEVLPNLKICNFFIAFPGDVGDIASVHIKSKECNVRLQYGQTISIKTSKGIELDPEIIIKPTQDGNTLIVRTKLSEKSSVLSLVRANLCDALNCLTAMEPLSESMVDSTVLAQCQQCRKDLCSGIIFRRVLPLPSLDWDAASEGWFCHLHGDHGNKLKPKSLLPGSDECYYTELYFSVHKHILKYFNVEKNSDTLFCLNCKAPLGDVNLHDNVKLWSHSIVWTKDGQILHNKKVNDILVDLFQNINKDNFGVNCRLVLESFSETKKYLYMITINTNMQLLGPKIDEDLDENFCNRTCDGDADIVNISLKKMYAVKLLYMLKDKEDAQTGEWVDDVHVSIIPCSQAFFDNALSLLEMSSSALSPETRTVDNMTVGYLFK